jgi:hypothetical protein
MIPTKQVETALIIHIPFYPLWPHIHTSGTTGPGRLAARLLADDPDIKPRPFSDVMSTGKLFSLNVYFQIEMGN